MKKTYTATLSRSPGRQAWAVIFRHPVRLDSSNRPGRRVRRGLGTDVKEHAQQLVDQLNDILSKEDMWTPSSRFLAQRLYDERVVSAFYDGLSVETADSEDLREEFIPLPDAKDGYKHVFVVGTTGAGKTTLVRQLLGMNVLTEPFPPTATGRTTVADLEIITAPGDYEVVATFLGRDHVRSLIEECLIEAALAASQNASEQAILRRILFHPAQRFRLAYLLGHLAPEADDSDDYGEEDVSQPEPELSDLSATRSLLAQIVHVLRGMVQDAVQSTRRDLSPSSPDDEKALAALLEESIVALLQASPRLPELVELIFSEMMKRFDVLRAQGRIQASSTGWPISWLWRTADRALLIRVLCLLVGNDARSFGKLLTPVVNGIRIKGPFAPKWIPTMPRFVLFDGEGLGHTPDTALALPTGMLERFESVDSILLVDNAAQPLQAAPMAILKGLATTGFHPKMHLIFTHLDQVKGPNLPTDQERKDHVRASLDNVIRDLGTRYGASVARGLSQRLEEHCYFTGNLHRPLDPAKLKRTIAELVRLVRALQEVPPPQKTDIVRPIYDRGTIVLLVQGAAERFHHDWNNRLRGEHWNRVRALSRRLAEGWADRYDTLDPIGDLVRELTERMRRYLDAPLSWDPADADEATRDARMNQLARGFTIGIIELARERLWRGRVQEWARAYAQSGQGSGQSRARIIRSGVYAPGVPLMADNAEPEAKAFLDAVNAIVNTVAGEVGAILK